MKKLSIIFDKKMRIVALLLTFTLIFDVFYYDSKQAHAVGETAVAAVASTAIPVVGPFIAVTLVACGVVGAVEWCRNHPEEVESIRKDLVNALNDAGESYAEGVKTNNDVNNASKVAGKEWIKSNIVDGKNYISSKILNTCLDVYSEHGLLNGVNTSVIQQEPIPKGHSFSVNNYDIYSYLDSLTLQSQIYKSLNSEVVKAIENFGTSDLVIDVHHFTKSGKYFVNYDIFKKSDFSSCTVYSQNTFDYQFQGLNSKGISYSLKNIGNPFHYISGSISEDGSIADTWNRTLSSNEVFNYMRTGVASFLLGLNDKYKNKYALNPCSNIGSISTTGIETSDRVAKKNPTTGAWELPWDTGANVNVQDVGESYPVSIPWENSYVWNPSKVDYPDIALPFPTDLDIPYPDIPITGIQEKIQTGEIELPEPIPNEPDIQENEDSYMLPKWIEDRFPFCIPKDLTSLATLFSSTSRQPPEWVAKLTYGDNKEFSIPINFKYKSSDGSASFDRIAYICRLIQFILFLCGLMMVTRNLLRS